MQFECLTVTVTVTVTQGKGWAFFGRQSSIDVYDDRPDLTHPFRGLPIVNYVKSVQLES